MIIYLNMLFITIICVLVIDDSGFINSIKYFIGKCLGIKNYSAIMLKPFDCSYCCSFWCNIIYLLITYNFTIQNILVALLLSTFTIQIYDIICLVKDLISKITNLIYEKLLQ